jgi:hypothetical protein
MRELLGGKGTINLLDCSAESAPNTELLVKKFPAFMELESSSPYPQVPATCPYPEPTTVHTLQTQLSIFFKNRHLTIGVISLCKLLLAARHRLFWDLYIFVRSFEVGGWREFALYSGFYINTAISRHIFTYKD